VTGAAGDIGRSICERFIRDGYEVYGWDVDAAGLQRLCRQIDNKSFHSVEVDLLDGASVVSAAAQTLSENETLNVLINNAGGVFDAPEFRNSQEAAFEMEIDLNLKSAWRTINALKDSLFAAGSSSIINMSSINGSGAFGYVGYSAAKAGLVQMTRSAAVEFGKFGVRANAVLPGSVRTKAWDERLENDPEIFANISKWYPQKDVALPADIAGVCAFLASDDARFVNGVALPVDGGLSAGIDIVAGQISQSDI